MISQYSLPELEAFLASIPLFAAVDKVTRRQLAEQLEPVHAAAGEVIIVQGEAGDGLFVVVSGRLRVSVAAGEAERDLRDLGRGSVVGEIALLSNRPRAATVRAVRDSDLLLLRAPVFKSLAERSRKVLGEVTQLLVDRLLAANWPREPSAASKTITVVPAGSSADAAAMVAERLTAHLTRAGSAFRVDADVVAGHLGPGAAQRRPGDLSDRRTGHFVEPALPEPVRRGSANRCCRR